MRWVLGGRSEEPLSDSAPSLRACRAPRPNACPGSCQPWRLGGVRRLADIRTSASDGTLRPGGKAGRSFRVGGAHRNARRQIHQRELLAVVGVERYGVEVKALAALLGKSRVTVSAWVSRGASKRATSARFREEVGKLDRGIAEA